MEGRKLQASKKSGLPFSWVSRKLPDLLSEAHLVLLPLGQVLCATWWVFWELHLPGLLRAQRTAFCNPPELRRLEGTATPPGPLK